MSEQSAKHRAWAAQNEALFKKWGEKKSKWPDWSLTILFYVAVHEAHAFLLDRNQNPRDHTTRNLLLRELSPTTIWPPYDALQKRSNRARYDRWMPDEDDIQEAVALLLRFRAAVAEEVKKRDEDEE